MCRATVFKVTLASSTFIKASSLFLRVEIALAIRAYYLRQRFIAHKIPPPLSCLHVPHALQRYRFFAYSLH
ncbi:hypothetical protein HK15_06140 [Acetobacter orientalis]|uniref:Uncharacterized protein n=1 Tax=Acetobacter orientalis TaxID=146474 RepID=A0A252BD68_9PROT|nr:hypothetical protein HK15_06140 [Acetobacter orientalis]